MKYYYILLIAMVVSIDTVRGQQEFSRTYEDFGVWSDVAVKYDLSKKWTGSTEIALRLDENASELRSTFVEVAFDRDLKKKFEVGTSARYVLRSNSQDGRISMYLKKYIRLKPINLKYRFKTDFNYDFFSESQDPLEIRYRNKFAIEYSRKKHDLGGSIAVEWFHNSEENIQLANDVRWKAGLDYKINKDLDISLNFIVQEELNTSRPVRDYVVSWGLRYEL